MTGAKIRLAAARGGAVVLSAGMLIFAVSHGCGRSREEGELIEEPSADELVLPEPQIAPSQESAAEEDVADDLEAGEDEAPRGAAAERAVTRNRGAGNSVPTDFLPATKAGGFLPADDDLLSTMQQQLGSEEEEDEQQQQGAVP